MADQRGQARPRKAYHHGDLRRALLSAAADILSRRGLSDLSLREAAEMAGVSPTAPYRHFSDKEALLAGLAEEGFLLLGARLKEALSSGDFLERLRAAGRAYLSFALSHPAHYRVMFGGAIGDRRRYEGLSAAARSSFGAIYSAISLGQRS